MLRTIGVVLQGMGEVVVALTVISVHTKIMHEHKIDAAVYKTMKRERNYVIIAIFAIVVGIVLQLVKY